MKSDFSVSLCPFLTFRHTDTRHKMDTFSKHRHTDTKWTQSLTIISFQNITKFLVSSENICLTYISSKICIIFFREVCSVTKKAVKKYTPQTRCEKIPVELCGPAGYFSVLTLFPYSSKSSNLEQKPCLDNGKMAGGIGLKRN